MTPKKKQSVESIENDPLTPPSVIPTDWLTVREVAQMLRTSEQSVRREMLLGHLRSADLMGGRKTRQTWLAEYIEERSATPDIGFRYSPEGKNRHSALPAEAIS